MAALACLASPPALLAQPLPDAETSAVYESFDHYDETPVSGTIIGETAKGYGLTGVWQTGNSGGAVPAGTARFVAPGLNFGPRYVNGTGDGKCLQIGFSNDAAVGAWIDGGKAIGDMALNAMDKLFYSYLIQHQATGTSAGRLEVRVSNQPNGTSGARMNTATDRHVSGQLRPSLSYGDGTWTADQGISLVHAAENAPVYMVIGRFDKVGNARTFSKTGTWTEGATTITVTNTDGLYLGYTINHAHFSGATIEAISGNTITLSRATTNSANNTAVTITPRRAVTGSWTEGQTTITVSDASSFTAPCSITGTGIGNYTWVTSISGNTLTLSHATTGTGTTASLTNRTGIGTMYILTYDQFVSFQDHPTMGGTNTYLDTVAIGTGNDQVTYRHSGSSNGGAAFTHGDAMNIVGGAGQKFKIDEMRFGMTLKSVTTPASYPAVTNYEIVEDHFDLLYSEPHDGGTGWKSGWFLPSQGAVANAGDFAKLFIYQWGDDELIPGGGRYLAYDASAISGSDQGIRRKPDPAFVDMSQPHTVSFVYQLAAGWGSFTAFADRIQIGADGPTAAAQQRAPNLGPNPSAAHNLTWMIGAVGAGDSVRFQEEGMARHWYCYDFDDKSETISGSQNFFVNGNIHMTEVPVDSRILRFIVDVNPGNYTYRLTIRDAITDEELFRSPKDHRFRVEASAHSLFWGFSKNANDFRSFNMDELRITRGIEQQDAYPSWMANYESSVPPDLRDRAADADNDGLPNFAEFALDGHPGSGAGNQRIVSVTKEYSGSSYYTLTIPVRNGVEFNTGTGPRISTGPVQGLTYKVEGSYNLSSFDENVVEVTPAEDPGVPLSDPAAYSYKTFRLAEPVTAQPKGFLRAVISDE